MNYDIDENGVSNINTASVMSYHTVLRNSFEYTEALRYARIVADNLTLTLDIPGAEIFPYR